MKTKFLCLALCVLLITSCEKTVSFKLEQASPKLVVEAVIENGEYPIVYLSKSMNFFSTIDVNTLSNNFVHNADIYVSTSLQTMKLKEYSVPVPGGFTFYYYSADTSMPVFRGRLKQQYSILIVSEGKEYTGSTTIPDTTKHIDSLYWKQAPLNNPPEKVLLVVKATDPPGYGDYIRYFTQRNSEPFYPGLTSVYDDQLIDGTTYEVQVERGVDRNVDHPDGYTYFNKGDTIVLKLCNIDKGVYDFWRTMEFSYSNIGNPFSTPTKVISNINGGALGYFGGYAAQYRRIIIPL
jgi:hypothetical protein